MEADKKLYDLSMLNDMSGNDITFIKEMVSLFTNNTPKVINNMRDLTARQDWESLRHVAHKFLSNVNMIGIKSIVQEVDLLESYSLNKENLNEIPELIQRVDVVCNAVIAQLKNEFKV